jgi:hypothetical protein
VFVVPTALRDREPTAIVLSAFVENQNAVAALCRIPPTEAGACPQVLERRIVLSTIWDEGLERIEGRDPALHEWAAAEFGKVEVHFGGSLTDRA